MKNKLDRNSVCQLLGISQKSYYRWKETRKIFKLLEKYFTKEDLEEFLNTNKIKKLERNEYIFQELIEFNYDKYLSTFANSNSLQIAKYDFAVFYFTFLNELKKGINNQKDVCDTFLFHPFFYENDLNLLLNIFLASFSFDYSSNSKNVFLGKFYGIQKKINIFSKWDNYMSIFLKECIESNFTILYKKNRNEEILNESMYHVLGFYVFSNFTNISDTKKMEKLKDLFKIYKSFTIEEKKSCNADQILSLILSVQKNLE